MEYAQFVEQVRIFQKKTKNLELAIHNAIDYCIAHDIMAEILRENRGGVEKMLLTEFDMKEYVKAEKREGEERLAALLRQLLSENRIEDIEKVVSDDAYRKKMYKKYDIED